MNLYLNALSKLGESIRSNDFYILVVAIITTVFMILTIAFSVSTGKRLKEWKKNKDQQFSKYLLFCIKLCYTLFTTLITIFPLLGMLGTVVGLLGLDITGGDMENIKANFFIALTSTAWGIIFSVIFKIAHAIMCDPVEDNIKEASKLV